jgi:hypothetical protein
MTLRLQQQQKLYQLQSISYIERLIKKQKITSILLT